MKSKYIAESGIITALIVIILYMASILPISTLSILTAASCLIPISLIRTNIKYSIAIYLCSSILSFFMLPLKISISYAVFFGLYGILKSYIERLHKMPIEILLKLISFNILLFIAYFLCNNIIELSTIHSSLLVILASAQIIFLIYDYALTLLISIYISKIHNRH